MDFGSFLRSGSGRSLQEIQDSTGILSGLDSQILRSFCANTISNLDTGLSDAYGRLIKRGLTQPFKNHFDSRVQALGSHSAAVKELEDKRWGPTRLPIYNIVLQFLYLKKRDRQNYLALARYMVNEAKIPVDGVDMAGNSALMYAIGTKPYTEPNFAQLLFDAGANINRRNRYGCTAAHDIVQVATPDGQRQRLAADMLKWFIEHGGDVNIADGDGIPARFIAVKLKPRVPQLAAVIETARATSSNRRNASSGRITSLITGTSAETANSERTTTTICFQCLRLPRAGEPTFQRCARCKTPFYCGIDCQKLAWKQHKRICQAVNAPPPESVSIDSVQGVRLSCSKDPGLFRANPIPSNHPMFDYPALSVPALVYIPLVIHRLGTKSSDRADLDCQVATNLNIDPINGLAPPVWQSHVGSCVVARKDQKPLSVEHLEIVWMFISQILNWFGEDGLEAAHRLYSRQEFEKFEENYKKENIKKGRSEFEGVVSIYDV